MFFAEITSAEAGAPGTVLDCSVMGPKSLWPAAGCIYLDGLLQTNTNIKVVSLIMRPYKYLIHTGKSHGDFAAQFNNDVEIYKRPIAFSFKLIFQRALLGVLAAIVFGCKKLLLAAALVVADTFLEKLYQVKTALT